MFWYGHPLISEGAGRIKTDSLNEQRIQKVLSRFEEWSKSHNLQSFKYSVSESQLRRNMIILPLAGLAIGQLGSQTFVHPKSRYIGKCFTILTTALGYVVYDHYLQTYNVTRRFGNYRAYPPQIKRMIDNNDSRYAFKWLNDNFLENKPEGTPAQQASTEQQNGQGEAEQ